MAKTAVLDQAKIVEPRLPSDAEWRQIVGEGRRIALKYFVNHDGSGCVDGLTAQEATSIGFYTALKRWEARQRN